MEYWKKEKVKEKFASLVWNNYLYPSYKKPKTPAGGLLILSQLLRSICIMYSILKLIPY